VEAFLNQHILNACLEIIAGKLVVVGLKREISLTVHLLILLGPCSYGSLIKLLIVEKVLSGLLTHRLLVVIHDFIELLS